MSGLRTNRGLGEGTSEGRAKFVRNICRCHTVQTIDTAPEETAPEDTATMETASKETSHT